MEGVKVVPEVEVVAGVQSQQPSTQMLRLRSPRPAAAMSVPPQVTLLTLESLAARKQKQQKRVAKKARVALPRLSLSLTKRLLQSQESVSNKSATVTLECVLLRLRLCLCLSVLWTPSCNLSRNYLCLCHRR